MKNQYKHIETIVKTIMPKRSKLPILENVALENNTVRATDLEISALIPFESGINLCVPVNSFLDAIKKENPTFQQLNNENVIINNSVTVVGEKIDEFPSWQFEGKPYATFTKENIEKMYIASLFAEKPENKRHIEHIQFQGVYIDTEEFVATDGHRLYHIPHGLMFELNCIVPIKVISLLNKLDRNFVAYIQTEMQTITERKSVSHIKFVSCDGIEIISKVISEKYPSWKTVIPEKSTMQHAVTFDKKELIATIKEAKPYSNVRSKRVKLSINGSCNISAQDIDCGKEFAKDIPCTHSGELIEIGFNADLLLTIAQVVDGNVVQMFIDNPHRATLIGDEMLLMPVKL